MLLRSASQLAPSELHIEPWDISDIPLYNGDIDNDEARPKSVNALKDAIASADAVLIATPEYNHSVPGVLQNAIDWVSRPAGKSPLVDKPVGIIGASMGAIGGARGQQQLKLVLYSTLAHVMPHPGVTVGNAHQKFNESGELTDDATRQFLGKFMQQFASYVARFRPARNVSGRAA
jgi:chromate reductase